MTAEIINFRKARKAKARSDKEARAGENRAAFGRTKTERQASGKAKSKIERELDGAKLEPSAARDRMNSEENE